MSVPKSVPALCEKPLPGWRMNSARTLLKHVRYRSRPCTQGLSDRCAM
eukprot:CAMPEP_0203953202 /NCGR_PEP_ID=MMETSP0359-20131031/86635_1 /ASSEMBLY_ACC=CAM_ASM_000338 /TAXON_ID=268821 /ORGANISM="Scrippsiella Hangoei, Strain SHTV-5" /LENGTH=47 /DNA_ID= /DNA_START= /DNA_END= /DNA_ORIENTATION=